jgi:uncharacterized membrane protein
VTPLLPHRFFLCFSLVGGAALAIVQPPFGVADETAHFLRAYDISTGHPWPEIRPEGAGSELPRSLVALEAALPAGPGRKADLRSIGAAFARRLAPSERAFVDFRGAAWSSFVPYLPQAVAIAVGRFWGAGPLALFYLARFANLLVCSALTARALRFFPSGRWLMTMIALTPMASSLRSSVSPDAALLAVAFAFTGLVAAAAFDRERAVGTAAASAMIGAAGGLALTKLPYAPLLVLVLAIPAERLATLGRRRFLAAYSTVSLTALLISLAGWQRTALPLRPDVAVDRAQQAHALLADPLGAARVIARDALVHAPRYVAQMIGWRLGWLDTPLPLVVVVAVLAVLVMLVAFDARSASLPQASQRLLLLAAVGASSLLILISQYVVWTPAGAATLEGVQGRYFLPLAPAAALLLQTRRLAGRCRLADEDAGRWLGLFCTALFVASCAAVVIASYAPPSSG